MYRAVSLLLIVLNCASLWTTSQGFCEVIDPNMARLLAISVQFLLMAMLLHLRNIQLRGSSILFFGVLAICLMISISGSFLTFHKKLKGEALQASYQNLLQKEQREYRLKVLGAMDTKRKLLVQKANKAKRKFNAARLRMQQEKHGTGGVSKLGIGPRFRYYRKRSQHYQKEWAEVRAGIKRLDWSREIITYASDAKAINKAMRGVMSLLESPADLLRAAPKEHRARPSYLSMLLSDISSPDRLLWLALVLACLIDLLSLLTAMVSALLFQLEQKHQEPEDVAQICEQLLVSLQTSYPNTAAAQKALHLILYLLGSLIDQREITLQPEEVVRARALLSVLQAWRLISFSKKDTVRALSSAYVLRDLQLQAPIQYVRKYRTHRMVLRGYREGSCRFSASMRRIVLRFLQEVMATYLYGQVPRQITRVHMAIALGTTDAVKFRNPHHCWVRRRYRQQARDLRELGVLLREPRSCQDYLGMCRALHPFRFARQQLNLPLRKLKLGWYTISQEGSRFRTSRLVIKVEWLEAVQAREQKTPSPPSFAPATLDNSAKPTL